MRQRSKRPARSEKMSPRLWRGTPFIRIFSGAVETRLRYKVGKQRAYRDSDIHRPFRNRKNAHTKRLHFLNSLANLLLRCCNVRPATGGIKRATTAMALTRRGVLSVKLCAHRTTVLRVRTVTALSIPINIATLKAKLAKDPAAGQGLGGKLRTAGSLIPSWRGSYLSKFTRG